MKSLELVMLAMLLASAYARRTCQQATAVNSLPLGLTQQTNDSPTGDLISNDCRVTDSSLATAWYEYTAGDTNEVLYATIDNQSGSTGLAVFSGACGALECIESTGRSSFSARTVEFAAIAGETYFVAGISVPDSRFDLEIQKYDVDVGNIACATAFDLTPSLPYSAVVNTKGGFVPFSNTECGVEDTVRGLWYTVTPDSDSLIVARFTDQDFTVRLTAFTSSLSGNACEEAELECVAQTGASQYSDRELEWPLRAGQTIYIYLSGSNSFDQAGGVTLSVQALQTEFGNDECSDARDISALLPYSEFDDSRASFPSGLTDLKCDLDTDDRGLWYKVLNPSENKILKATFTNQEFSGKLSVFLSDTGDCQSQLECVSATGSSQYSARSLTWAAAAGTTSFIHVSGSDRGGVFELIVEELELIDGNGVCSGAKDISAMLPYSSVDSNVGGFPSFTDQECWVKEDSRGAWYQVSLTEDRIIRATVSDQTFSARVSAFVGSCDQLSCVIGNEDDFTYVDRQIVFALPAGTTAYIHVSGDSFEEAGTFGITIEAIDRPTNYQCPGATQVPSLPFSAFEESDGAFPTITDLECNLADTSRAMWYSYTPPKTSEGQVVRAILEEKDFDAYLSLMRGECDSLQCAGSEGPYQYSDVGFVFPTYPGQTEYLIVHGQNFQAGDFGMRITGLERPANDVCEGATEMSAPGRAFETNTASLPLFSSDACNVHPESRVNWFEFNPTETATYEALVRDNTWDAVLSIFSGDDCETMTCLGFEEQCFVILPVFPFIVNCDFGLSFTAIAGQTYYLAVSGQDGFVEDGTFALEIERVGPASPTTPPVTSRPTPAPVAPVQSPTRRPTPAPNSAPNQPVEQPVTPPSTASGGEGTLEPVSFEVSNLSQTLFGIDVLSVQDVRNWESAAADHVKSFWSNRGLVNFETVVDVTNLQELIASDTSVARSRGGDDGSRRRLQDSVTIEYFQSISYDKSSTDDEALTEQALALEPFASAQSRSSFVQSLSDMGGGFDNLEFIAVADNEDSGNNGSPDDDILTRGNGGDDASYQYASVTAMMISILVTLVL